MKIAFHNTGGFTPRWIEYCEKNNIQYKKVNAYDTDIVEQLKDCDAFMWHHHQSNYKDVLFAKQLLFSLEQGKLYFPTRLQDGILTIKLAKNTFSKQSVLLLYLHLFSTQKKMLMNGLTRHHFQRYSN